jgi:hypothetical protein
VEEVDSRQNRGALASRMALGGLLLLLRIGKIRAGSRPIMT